MLNGVLRSVSYTKRIHLLCEVPPRDLCEPRKTSKRKLSYRFWKESWCIYFPILQQRSSVFFSAVQSLPSFGTGRAGPTEDGHTQGLFSACEQMRSNESGEKSGLFQPSGTSWGGTAQPGPACSQGTWCCRGWVLIYSWKGEQARRGWAVKKLNSQCFCIPFIVLLSYTESNLAQGAHRLSMEWVRHTDPDSELRSSCTTRNWSPGRDGAEGSGGKQHWAAALQQEHSPSPALKVTLHGHFHIEKEKQETDSRTHFRSILNCDSKEWKFRT